MLTDWRHLSLSVELRHQMHFLVVGFTSVKGIGEVLSAGTLSEPQQQKRAHFVSAAFGHESVPAPNMCSEHHAHHAHLATSRAGLSS